MAKPSLAYRIFRVVIFPGIILVFAVGWVLYVTGKKYEKPPSPAPVRTDLNTPNKLFETSAEMRNNSDQVCYHIYPRNRNMQ